MNNKQKGICFLAMYTFGFGNQKDVAIEEMSELIKEIVKDKRGLTDRNHLLEELVDVEIMLLQLKKIYMFSDTELNEMMERKINRLSTYITQYEALEELDNVSRL